MPAGLGKKEHAVDDLVVRQLVLHTVAPLGQHITDQPLQLNLTKGAPGRAIRQDLLQADDASREFGDILLCLVDQGQPLLNFGEGGRCLLETFGKAPVNDPSDFEKPLVGRFGQPLHAAAQLVGMARERGSDLVLDPVSAALESSLQAPIAFGMLPLETLPQLTEALGEGLLQLVSRLLLVLAGMGELFTHILVQASQDFFVVARLPTQLRCQGVAALALLLEPGVQSDGRSLHVPLTGQQVEDKRTYNKQGDQRDDNDRQLGHHGAAGKSGTASQFSLG